MCSQHVLEAFCDLNVSLIPLKRKSVALVQIF